MQSIQVSNKNAKLLEKLVKNGTFKDSNAAFNYFVKNVDLPERSVDYSNVVIDSKSAGNGNTKTQD